MPKLIIDDRKVTVPRGTTILDAAKNVGIAIPTLCHDDRLHPYGACRICVVEVVGPVARMVASCTTPAADNMMIKTASPAVLDARRSILELLLINHPLDCPVCDKAGECRLQDLVHEYGLGPSGFSEEKRTPAPDRASAVIERNPSRCILCGKCVRLCREQNAVSHLAMTRRGGASRVSTSCDRPLDCEFCGACVEICPTGALATKQFKFTARSWSLEETPSACAYCGNGCRTKLQTRKGRVVRVKPEGSGCLCSRGRFGWDAARHESRLLSPKMRVNGELVDCTWQEALERTAAAFGRIRSERGADAIAGLGSVRTSNEDNYLFQKFMRNVVGTNNVDFLGRLKLPRGLNTAYFAPELASLGESDVIVLLEPQAGEINPATGIEISRAVNRSGRKLILAGGRDGKFSRIAELHFEDKSAETLLWDLIASIGGGFRTQGGDLAAAGRMLLAAHRVSIVLPAEPSAALLDRSRYLAALLGQTQLFPIIRRGNLQGCLDMGVLPDHLPGYQRITGATAASLSAAWGGTVPETPGRNALEIVNEVIAGSIGGLYIMGDDPIENAPGLAPMFESLDFLVVQDIFLTETAKHADVVLPAASFLERDGTITNLERRLLAQSRAEDPAGQAMPDWEIIRDLANAMGTAMPYRSAAAIMREIRSLVPLYRDVPAGRCWPKERSPLAGTAAELALHGESALRRERVAGRLLFSSGSMLRRSQEIATIPRVHFADCDQVVYFDAALLQRNEVRHARD